MPNSSIPELLLHSHDLYTSTLPNLQGSTVIHTVSPKKKTLIVTSLFLVSIELLGRRIQGSSAQSLISFRFELVQEP